MSLNYIITVSFFHVQLNVGNEGMPEHTQIPNKRSFINRNEYIFPYSEAQQIESIDR